MNEHRCRNCVWWQIPDELSYYAVFEVYDPDTMKPMDNIIEVRKCCSPQLLFHERPPTTMVASIYDGSDYFGMLISGGDFGCVNWEGKK